MKATGIIIVSLLVVGASAAYVMLRPVQTPASHPVHEVAPEAVVIPETVEPATIPQSAEVVVAEEKAIQPLEERGDAMLFEIDALQNMPFDEEIVMPFD